MKRRKKIHLNIFTIPEAQAHQVVKDALEQGCLLWIEGSAWGNRKKVAVELLQQAGLKADVASAIRATQTLLDKEEVRKVVLPIDKAHDLARKPGIGLPWLSYGVHFIYKTKIEVVEAFLEECKAEQVVAKEILLEKLPELRAKKQAENPELYNPHNYPPDWMIAEKFNLRWVLMPVSLPGDAKVSVLSKEQLAKEDAKIRSMIMETGERSVQMIRGTFLEIMTHLTKVLKGDSKRWHTSTLDKPKAYLKELKDVPFLSCDKHFLKLAADCEDVLNGVYAEDLKDDEEYRKAMSNILEDVVQDFKALPTVKLGRSIDF